MAPPHSATTTVAICAGLAAAAGLAYTYSSRRPRTLRGQPHLHPPASALDPDWAPPCPPHPADAPDPYAEFAGLSPRALDAVSVPAPLEGGATLRWVATPAALAAAASAIASAAAAGSALGIDVEHSSEAYYGRVCLVQVAAGGITWVLDALALGPALADAAPGSPGSALRSLLASPSVLKVFHGATTDLAWLARDLGWRAPACAVWDTAAAARASALPGGDGLASLLSAASARAAAHAAAGGDGDAAAVAGLATAAAGAARDKRDGLSTAQDWRARPLPAAALLYAARDAHYLEFAAACLASEGGSGSRSGAWPGLSGWAPPSPAAPPDALPPSTSAPPNTPAAVADAVLALALWRDAAARRADVPPTAFVPDAALAALATTTGRSAPAAAVRELAAGGDRRAAAAVVLRVARAAAGGADALPHLTAAAADGAVSALEVAAAGVVAWATAGGPAAALPACPDAADAAAAAAAAARRAALRRARAIERFRCKRAAVYEDCRLLSRDGHLLCCCDAKKLAWYVGRGLAVPVPPVRPGDPPSARLTFAHRDDDQRAAAAGCASAADALAFYSAPRPNACVGCGEAGHWLRYRLVPAAYRKPLPASLKAHRAHDVVLLCVPCHERAMRAAEGVKRAIAAEVGVPLGPAAAAAALAGGSGEDGGRPAGDSSDAAAAAAAAVGAAARRAAVTLHRHGSSLPAERRGELEADLRAGLEAAGDARAAHMRAADLAAVASALAAAAPRRDAVRMCAAMGLPKPPLPPASSGESEGEGSPVAGPPTPGRGRSPCESGGDEVDEEGGDDTAPPPQKASSSRRRSRRAPLPGTHRWHGEQVVAALLTRGGEAALHDLIVRFRRAFLAGVQPAYLPQGWSLEHGLPQLAG